MMADDREPPPFFDDEETTPKEQDDEDLFSSAVESPQSDSSKKADDKHTSEDLFAAGSEEVDFDDPPAKHHQYIQEMDSPSDPPKLQTSSSSATTKRAASVTKTKDEIEEESGGDQFITISITDPQKIGDGMNAYMAYKVCTKTNIPAFRKSDFFAMRRFSDFLGLHDKLVEKHVHIGRIVPPAPEKSVIGMTKIKMSKEESVSMDFVEKRRAALERYLNRTATHPVLLLDPDFREFLEMQGELPKATSTSALSGAGVMRLFSKVGDTVNKMTYKMEENDLWFEEKQQQIDNLDLQLRKLHLSVESLVHHRKELASSTASFAKSAAMLSNCEEHTALSRALSQLAEVEEKIEQLQQEQANVDFYVLSELLKDYVNQIIAIKVVFHQRVKVYHNWQTAKATLTKKRENKAKLELAGKNDKLPQAKDEVTEWENKVDAGETEFLNISKMIRKEMESFEKIRVKDFKINIIKYMESLMSTQQQLIKYWEAFLPEAKAIA